MPETVRKPPGHTGGGDARLGSMNRQARTGGSPPPRQRPLRQSLHAGNEETASYLYDCHWAEGLARKALCSGGSYSAGARAEAAGGDPTAWAPPSEGLTTKVRRYGIV